MAFNHLRGPLAAVILLGGTLPNAAQIRYVADEESRLWIEGRSNINRFECGASTYDLDVLLHQESAAHDLVSVPNDLVSIEVTIPVDGFRCGKERMEGDLKAALRADDFLAIRFVFIRATDVTPPSAVDESRRLCTAGNLSIGLVRQYLIHSARHGHRARWGEESVSYFLTNP